jgi:splicing factor 3B subunit 1
MLMDEDFYIRLEGREVVCHLTEAVGLPTILQAVVPDIDHADGTVRNTSSMTLAATATACGLPAMLPFLRAVIASRKNWETRHTGVRVISKIAQIMGCGVLANLPELV